MGSGTRRHEGARKPRRTKGAVDAGGAAAVDAEWDAQFDEEFERESAELERSGRTLTRVLFFVFLGVSVLMLAIAVLTGLSTRRALAHEQTVLGQVTAMTERKDSEGNTYYYPTVAFDVPDGGRYNVQLGQGSWPPRHRVGDLVTVMYDEQNPMNARIGSDGSFDPWIWPLVTGILGVAFLLAAVLAWALGRQTS